MRQVMGLRLVSMLFAAVALVFAACSPAPAPEAKPEATTPAAAAPATSAPEAEPLPVAEGEEAPDFTLPASTGEEITLSALRGKPVVLYFYPKDETPGCTKQACGFRDAMAAIDAKGAHVLGVSLDSIDSHLAFKENHQLNFPLLADTSGSVAALYGVLGEYAPPDGSPPFAIAKRVTFLIGPDGFVRKIWQNVDVTTHATDVVAALETL